MPKAIENAYTLRDVVNVGARSGADKTGVTDSSAAFLAAIALGPLLFVPEGTWAANITVSDSLILEGAGSNKTFITPFDTTVAAVTYTKTGPYWTYNSQVNNLCLKGTAKIGVGFTFGRTEVFLPDGTTPTFVAGDQYANNVVFRNVDFRGLRKGIQFPYGNIGTEFYSCGFHDNFYGAYLLDNKFGGDIMHAGNKYWYGGEWSGNDCALYLSNATVGFGGIGIHGTIVEYNKIAIYTSLTVEQFLPIEVQGAWFEGNGQTNGLSAETVSIDLWVGATRTLQALTKRTFIIDGALGRFNFTGGNFTDANVAANEAHIYCFGSIVEKNSGYLGGSVDVNTGEVIFDSCASTGGFPTGFGIICIGATTTTGVAVDSSPSNGSRRGLLTTARRSRIPGLLVGGVADPLILSRTATGTFSVVGTVVADGQVFASCNEFSASYSVGQYTGLSTTSVTTSEAGWHVVTVDCRLLAGSPLFYIWDRSASLVATGIAAPYIGNWFTIAAIVYADAAGKTWFFDWGNPTSTQTVTLRASAYQCQRFDSHALAKQFLASEAYSFDGASSGWTADTGTAKRTANVTYAGGTASVGYVQAELQGAMDAAKNNSQTIKALKDDLIAQGVLKA